jgi:endothelin-converting enzyme/putative endopeptidase
MRFDARLPIALLCAAALAHTASAQTTETRTPEGFSLEFLDRRVDACTDFYQFACGNWMARNPLPPDRSRLGRIQQLADRNDVLIRGILEHAAAKAYRRTDAEQKIGDYYASCMDETAIQVKGARALAPLLREIEIARTPALFIRAAARFARRGVDSIVRVEAAPDLRNSSLTIAHLWPGALGLPDRDLYTSDDERSTRLRREYQAHLVTMLELLGGPVQNAKGDAVRILDAETVLARAMMPRVALRDPRKRDNPARLEQIERVYPALELGDYLRELGAPALTQLNLVDPSYLKELNASFATLPLATWHAYLKWRVLSTLAPLLSPPFEKERFRFTGTVLSGTREMAARWKRCTGQVAGVRGDDELGEIVGQIFVNEHFGADARHRMAQLIVALEQSLDRNIRELEWMTPETKLRALAKLKEIDNKVGAPDKWRDFSRVTIVRNDVVANALNVGAEQVRYELSFIGKRTDPSIWQMTPHTVNAYYGAPRNEVVFPAGILQPPFFDATRDDAINFGGIGAVIGHELSHGFDDQGRKYDAQGNLTDWWAANDDSAFRERAACVANQYSGYATVGETRLNGELTLGENVADNAGVRIAYYALMEVLGGGGTASSAIEGFTSQQRFFLAWAQVWCENATDQDYKRRAQEDSHSPGRWRANGVLQNSDEFRKAFGCAQGTPMAPEKTCRVW